MNEIMMSGIKMKLDKSKKSGAPAGLMEKIYDNNLKTEVEVIEPVENAPVVANPSPAEKSKTRSRKKAVQTETSDE